MSRRGGGKQLVGTQTQGWGRKLLGVSDSPGCRVSGKGDTGCDLDGFLIIFIRNVILSFSSGRTVPSEIRIINRGTLITLLSTLIDPDQGRLKGSWLLLSAVPARGAEQETQQLPRS